MRRRVARPSHDVARISRLSGSRPVSIPSQPHRERDHEAEQEADCIQRAPHADRTDHEQLEIREVGLEQHADERQHVVRQQQRRSIGAPPRQREPHQRDRQDHAEDRDRNAVDARVLAVGDRLAASRRSRRWVPRRAAPRTRGSWRSPGRSRRAPRAGSRDARTAVPSQVVDRGIRQVVGPPRHPTRDQCGSCFQSCLRSSDHHAAPERPSTRAIRMPRRAIRHGPSGHDAHAFGVDGREAWAHAQRRHDPCHRHAPVKRPSRYRPRDRSPGRRRAPPFPGIPAIVDGSEAIAHVETRISEGSCAYPITPSTTMAAVYQAAVADGRTEPVGHAAALPRARIGALRARPRPRASRSPVAG